MSLQQRSQTSAYPAAPPSSGQIRHGGMISDLLVRCGCGDEDAFLVLFDTLYPVVFTTTATLVPPQAVDRSVQAAFVAIWEDAPRYRPGGVSSVSWVMRHVIAASSATRRLTSAPTRVSTVDR